MTTAVSLDQRYLEFADKTAGVFARFPEMEPVRYDVFRNVLVHRRSVGLLDAAKQWVRPLVRRTRTADPLPKADILMWVEGTRSIIRDTIMPVADELRRRGERVQLMVFNGPGGLPDAVTCQCPAVGRAPSWADGAWEALSRAEPDLATSDARRTFLHACADGHSVLSEVQRLVEGIEPRVVVTASTQLIGGCAAVVAARKHGLRSLVLQHGLLQPLYVPLVADVMCTWGPSSSDTLTRLGVDPGRLVPLGSPRHDAMTPSCDGTARQALLRCLSLDDKPAIVFFSNGNDVQRNGPAPEECAQWMEAVARGYRKRVNIIVRLHPNEDGALYRDCRHLKVTKDRPDFAVLLGGCDGVASLCSTALYEALLFRKPIWQLAAPGWPDLADNWKQGLARRVTSREDLEGQIGRWLEAKGAGSRFEWPVEAVFANHGAAARAVAGFIHSQVQGMPAQEVRAAGRAPKAAGTSGT